MDNYYATESGGGCFGETSTVMVVDAAGNQKATLITLLKKGDKIVSSQGTAIVRCVAKIARDSRKPLIAFSSGLTITKRHPIRLNGAWTLPHLVEKNTVANPSGFVYNLVLESDHVAIINGIECCTWGHGLTDPVV